MNEQTIDASQTFLTIDQISKKFTETTALNKVSLQVKKGEFFSLLGKSGCGKTTLLRIISGLEKQTSGRVLLGKKDISFSEPKARSCAMVFQSYALIPHMNAFENIAYALKGKKISKKDISEKVLHCLKLVQLEHLRDRYPNEMSGGQQQRISLARALVLEPDLLLLDEPFSALDTQAREHLHNEIRTLLKQLNITTILVTHDQQEAFKLSDKIALMQEGQILQIGSPEELYHSPSSHFIAQFVGAKNQLFFEDKIQFIHPNQLSYSWEAQENYSLCHIQTVEFLGSFFRVYIRDKKDRQFILEIPSMNLTRDDLQNKKEIYVNLYGSIS